MDEKNLKLLRDSFGILKIEKSYTKSSYDDFQYTMDYNFSKNIAIPIATTYNYEILAESYFVETLLKMIQNSKYGSDTSLSDMYDELQKQYHKEKQELKLQREHPELAEIMRDYNVTKALILQEKYK